MSLTEALRAGEQKVFATLYDEHAVQLYAYCHTMVGDEAGDAVRDAFIAAARHRGTAPGDEALPRWLYGLARAECVRRGALTRRPAMSAAAAPFDRAFARLRPEHREALVLTDHLEDDDLAKVVGVAPDTARSLVRMAGRRLEQAAISVLGGRASHDDEMIVALVSGRLHTLVPRSGELPADLRRRVLFSCEAAGRAADGALLFDEQGLPVEVHAVLGTGDADHPIDVIPLVEIPSARRRDSRNRRFDGMVKPLGLAACVAGAMAACALWPSPHPHGASDMHGTSRLLNGHRSSASRSASIPGTAPQGASSTPVPASGTSSRSPSASATPSGSAAPGSTRTPSATSAPSTPPVTTAPATSTPPATPAPTPTPGMPLSKLFRSPPVPGTTVPPGVPGAP